MQFGVTNCNRSVYYESDACKLPAGRCKISGARPIPRACQSLTILINSCLCSLLIIRPEFLPLGPGRQRRPQPLRSDDPSGHLRLAEHEVADTEAAFLGAELAVTSCEPLSTDAFELECCSRKQPAHNDIAWLAAVEHFVTFAH
jgi:hypothetical protein